MDTPRDGEELSEPDRPSAGDRPDGRESGLIDGRFRSMEDKAAWMLAGRERPDPADRPDTSSVEELAEFLLPELSDRDVSVYVATSVRDRPWLSILDADDPPEIWRAVVALDKGESHGLQRHSEYGDSTMHLRRVTRLEDPAQADPRLRELGVDGLHGGNHYCAVQQSRFTSVEAMVESYLRGKEHPRVRAALDTPYSPGPPPKDVNASLAELLGPDGHVDCEGFRLIGDAKQSKKARRAWEKDRLAWVDQHGDLAGFTAQPPEAERIPSFEGGTVVFRFGRNAAGDGYVITSHFPDISKEEDTNA